MVSYDLALGVVGIGGVAYSALTYFLPDLYLNADKSAKNDDTRAFVRSTGAGILGLTALCYIGATSHSDEVKKAACCALATSFIGYSGNNINRMMKGKEGSQVAMDTACCLGFGTLVTAALVMNKK